MVLFHRNLCLGGMMSDPCGQVFVFFYFQGPGIGFDNHQGIWQGGLACCIPWGHKESDTTERLNWTELKENKTWFTGTALLNFERPLMSLRCFVGVHRCWQFDFNNHNFNNFNNSHSNNDISVWFQLLSHVRHFATPWTTASQVSLSITNFWSLPKLMSLDI